jgi:anti-anti-sigma regulatory factor
LGCRTKSEFLTGAAQFIADGLAHDQWIQYVDPGSREDLRTELDTMGPITALCAYDISRLRSATGKLLCLHKLVGAQSPMFRRYAQEGAAFALDGEIDPARTGDFSTTLQRIWPVAGGDGVVVDIDGLTFISHRELLTLDRFARRDGRQVVMRGSSPVVRRLVPLLDLTYVILEPVSAN